MYKTISLDFDNVIHDMNDGWKDGTIYGEPVLESKKMVNLLIEKGIPLVITTSRSDLRPVRKWLKEKGFPKITVTNKKVPALFYLDDRALRFTNWSDIIRYFI